MAEQLARKKSIRGAHRSAITRTIGQIQNIIGEPEVDKARLRQKKLALEEKRDLVKSLDAEILQSVPVDELEGEVERADEVQEQLELAIVLAEKKLTETQSRPASPSHSTGPRPLESHPPGGVVPDAETVTSPPPAVSAGTVHPPHTHSRIKLPELSIKKFNGDLTKWSTFWDTFESTIHNSPSLSAIEKFSYLQSLLESSAAEAVSGLSLTSANYEEAVSTLKKRFGNKQLIISRHMDLLMNLESVSAQNDTRRLRRLFDAVESQVRGLKALGVPVEAYGGLLASVLLNKLPPEIRLIVSRGLTSDSWDLDRILELLESELTARERATPNQAKKPDQRRTHPTTSTFSTHTTPNCVYCGQDHTSDSCVAVPTTEARKQSLKQSGRCYVCLRRNHISRNCRSSTKCTHCRGKHHSSICHSRPDAVSGSSSETRDSSTHTTSTPVMYVNTKTQAMLQTATVIVHRPGFYQPTHRTRAVLDCGSQRTYVTSHIQRALSLPASGTEMVEIRTFGSTEGLKRSCNVVNLNIIARDGRPLRVSALVVPHICDATTQPLERLTRQFPHLSGLDLADERAPRSTSVDMLIGADHYWTLVSGQVQRGESGPVAIKTRVGWVLSGPIESETIEQSIVGIIGTHTLRVDTLTQEADVDDRLREFWELESMGIKPSEEESVHTKFTQAITFKNGRYEVTLPWRDGHNRLPENYEVCVKRLRGLHKRLQRDPELLKSYDQVIREQLRDGIVEEVAESPELPSLVHYLPHHAVVRKDKTTTKVRVVFDASCREGTALSLNQCLHVGPSFGQSILDILVRFRIHKIALVGDVEKAFLMVSVAERDRDVLRFLWFDNPLSSSPSLVKYRFTRVVFGVASSPFLLNATIKHHIDRYQESDPDFVFKFLRSIYVDDLTTGAATEDDCYEFYLKAKIRLAEAGFNLRKFASNSSDLLSRISANERGVSTIPAGVTEHKVLGVNWNSSTDEITFDVQAVVDSLEKLEPTKRGVVGAAARIYDPLGVLSPITISFKIFFQQLCQAQLSWDDVLTGELLNQWKTLTTELRQLKPISIPRWVSGMAKCSRQLIGFCDASNSAYAAVVYMRVVSEDMIRTTILAAKTRVAPLKPVTIPRLELLSAVLLARLIHSISCALGDEVLFDHTICFTDSKIALCWIRHVDKEWKMFVENRVSEVRRLTSPECWQHCPGTQNPADLPSRGLNPKEFEKRLKFWLQGPDWLKQPLCFESEHEDLIPDECLPELREVVQKALLTASVSEEKVTIVNVEDFSSLKRLLRVMSQVFRFIRLTRRQERGEVTMEDMQAAHDFLIRTAQAMLAQNVKFKQWTQQFGLYKDDQGVFRCRGRLSNASIPLDTMFPIFLEKGNALTRLIVKECHERVGHGGVSSTLTELRSKYWVIQGRQLVKKIIFSCALCRRFQGKSYQAPPTPPLPSIRVEEKPPFSYTGVDFAGPVFTRETLSSTACKVWICLFTCCVTRAVHIELVTEMTATTFLRCFRRFTSRRGTPIRVLSDNGKTFKGADKLLSSILNDPRVKNHFMENKVHWQFNVERAPWWGGVFERMIQSMKRLLRKIVGTAKLTFDELMTAIIEVEAFLNSRPLTYLAADEVIEPLTPSHLLCGRRLLTLPDIHVEDEEQYSPEADSNLTRRMKHLSRTLSHFWSRWRNEYLLELRNAHRNTSSNGSSGSQVSVGEVVIVEDEQHPRAFWKLGTVTELMTGKDGEARAAVVRTHSKDGKVISLRRPVQKLYPLEIKSPEDSQNCLQEDDSVNSTDEPPTRRDRPRRVAAFQARERIAAWSEDFKTKS